MTFFHHSLRLRLLTLILLPLILVSMAAVIWRYNEARKTAEAIFDRNLLMLSFAVARDVELSEGDSLSAATNALFKEVSGGDLYYHVKGPDGSFVTGYSSPPVFTQTSEQIENAPRLYDAVHLGQQVRVARLAEQAVIDGIGGLSVTTVWQKLDQRDAFARSIAFRAGAIVVLLLVTVALLVLFGIRLGLKPLLDLEDAIQKRSSHDLSPIARQVPIETKGIVTRLNTLFDQVTQAQKSKDRFISNAAHQLRNPIAAIHSMAQATHSAKDIKQVKSRAESLVAETRRAGRLTDQLLSLERLKGHSPKLQKMDLADIVQDTAAHLAADIMPRGLDISVQIEAAETSVLGHETLFREALTNLVDNALRHGGDELTIITIKVEKNQETCSVSVINDGNCFEHQNNKDLFDRFIQGSESQGSGLGLAIVKEIVAAHGGFVQIHPDAPARVTIYLPSLSE